MAAAVERLRLAMIDLRVDFGLSLRILHLIPRQLTRPRGCFISSRLVDEDQMRFSFCGPMAITTKKTMKINLLYFGLSRGREAGFTEWRFGMLEF